MKKSYENILVIAQKEFADSIWSPRFYAILGIFMFSLILNGYQSGRNASIMGAEGISPLMMGFMGFAGELITLGPLIAIVLGFDAIIKERKSGSLNVLLTHPVYRDQVITGKLLGMMIMLIFIVIISVGTATGLMIGVSGITISSEVISRIFIFMILAFLFMLSYLSLSVMISTFSKEAADSLVYSLAIWIVMGLMLMNIAFTAGELFAGDLRMFEGTTSSGNINMEKFTRITQGILSISPSTHLNELISGKNNKQMDFSEPDQTKKTEMQGLFDTSYTLEYWVTQNWVGITILLVIPVILLLVSYMAFMRQDITL